MCFNVFSVVYTKQCSTMFYLEKKIKVWIMVLIFFVGFFFFLQNVFFCPILVEHLKI